MKPSALEIEGRFLGPTLSASLREIYVFDPTSLRFLEASRGALRNLGLTIDELRELTPLDIKPDMTPESFKALIRPLTNGEQDSIVFETVHRRADGSLYPVDVHLEILGEEQRAFVAVIRDATEQQRVEQRRERRIMYLAAMDRINAAILKSNDVPMLLDRTVQELLGLLECDRVQVAKLKLEGPTITVEHEAHTHGNAWGQEVGLEVPVDEYLFVFFQRVLKSPSPVTMATDEIVSVLGKPTCELLNLRSATAFKICPRAGPHWMIGFHQCDEEREWTDLDQLFVRDVCHRLEDSITALLTQQQAHETHQLYRALFEQSNDGVLFIEPDTARILQFNDRAHLNLGYTREDFAQLKISDIDILEDEQAINKRCVKINAQGAEVFETKHVCKDGSTRDIEVRATPISVGNRPLVFSTWSDITSRKLVEREREERLWYLQAIERVNQAILSEDETEPMVKAVLDTLLEVLCCDRVTLVEIPDPGEKVLKVAFQRWREGYSGSLSFGEPIAFSSGIQRLAQAAREAKGVREYDAAEIQSLLGMELPEVFPLQSMLVNLILPRVGKHWCIVIKQCIKPRTWSKIEKNLVVEVSHRLEDALTALGSLKQLQQSQRALELAQHRAQLGSWVLSPQSNTGWWSAQMYELFEIDPESGPPTLEEFKQLVHPGDLDYLLGQHHKLVEGEISKIDIDYRTNPARGPLRHIQIVAHKEHTETGFVISGTSQDVTARKLSEYALQQSEEQLRLFIEHAPAALAMFDREMRYLSVTRRWKADYGLLGRDIIGRCHYDFFPELPERWKEVHRRAMQGVAIKAKQDRFDRADGRVQWIHWEVHPWLTFQGEIGGIMISAEEVTELVELNQKLESKVEQRTAQLKSSNSKLDEFAHTVSHDLRAPLRAMEGFAKALEEDYGATLEGDGVCYLEQIIASASRMDVLISDLLSYSRLGREDLEMKVISGNSLISEVLDNLKSEFSVKSAQVEVVTNLPEFYGHRSTLLQLFSNLLSNAIKFVAIENRPEIKIWHEQVGPGWARLNVQDNGIGIEPKYHELIFQAFQRLHGIETYPGTGIGLAIVSRACERHGGKCGVESQLGQGSLFWVELPTRSLQG